MGDVSAALAQDGQRKVMKPGQRDRRFFQYGGKLFDTENLLNPFQRLQQKTLGNRVGGRYPDQFNVLPVPEDFCRHFYITTFVETAKWWFACGLSEPPETIEAYYEAVVGKS